MLTAKVGGLFFWDPIHAFCVVLYCALSMDRTLAMSPFFCVYLSACWRCFVDRTFCFFRHFSHSFGRFEGTPKWMDAIGNDHFKRFPLRIIRYKSIDSRFCDIQRLGVYYGFGRFSKHLYPWLVLSRFYK